MSETIGLRQQQKMNSKIKLRETAMNLFKDRDYEDIQISEICATAEMSVGHFYNFYPSKEELIMDCYTFFDEVMVEDFKQRSFGNYSHAILALIRIQTEGALNCGPKLMAQMLRIQLKTGGKHAVEETRSFHVLLTELIGKAIIAGEINTTSEPKIIAYMFLRLSRGSLQDWAMKGGSYDVAEVVEKDLTSIMEMMKKK